MSAWTVGVLFVTVALAMCGIVLVRGSVETRLVALQFAASAAALDMLLVAQSFGNASAYDAALALALLSYPAGLVFARFYGRWL